jgi:2,3-bisphosphoglycerate-dependent phosphoglycerate mutase
MNKIFLIRHGESQSNVGLATTDPREVGLTLRGHKQAEQIAVFLRDYTALNRIVTSAYVRTKQTAKPMSMTFPTASMEERAIQEFTYLSPAYIGYSTVYERRPLVDAYWEQCDPSFNDGHGSESFKAFMDRVQGFIRQLKDKRENIAIFSHEQFISAVLWFLKYQPTEITSDVMRDFRNFYDQNRILNGAIVEISVRHSRDSPDVWFCRYITHHLGCPEPEPSPVKPAMPLAVALV